MDGSAIDFTNWASGEPDYSTFCGYFNPTYGRWYDDTCASSSYEKYAVLCNPIPKNATNVTRKEYNVFTVTSSDDAMNWPQAQLEV